MTRHRDARELEVERTTDGWSLHLPGDPQPILCGPAADGDDARPDADDYEEAQRILDTLLPQLRAALVAGDVATISDLDAWDIAEDYEEDYGERPAEGPALLEPGWYADDGQAEVYYPTAASGRAAAQEYADDGDWGPDAELRTVRLHVGAWRKGYALDSGCRLVRVRAHYADHDIDLEPEEPVCDSSQGEHRWVEVDGSLQCSGGSVRYEETCVRCGWRRLVDGWDTDSETGEHYRSVRYEESDDDELVGEED